MNVYFGLQKMVYKIKSQRKNSKGTDLLSMFSDQVNLSVFGNLTSRLRYSSKDSHYCLFGINAKGDQNFVLLTNFGDVGKYAYLIRNPTVYKIERRTPFVAYQRSKEVLDKHVLINSLGGRFLHEYSVSRLTDVLDEKSLKKKATSL